MLTYTAFHCCCSQDEDAEKLLSGGRRRRWNKKGWWGWGGGSRAVQAGFTCLTRCHGYPRCVRHSAQTRIDRDSDTQTQTLPWTRVAPLRSVSVTKNTLTKNRNLSRILHRVWYFQNIPKGFCLCRQTVIFPGWDGSDQAAFKFYRRKTSVGKLLWWTKVTDVISSGWRCPTT